MIKKRNNSYGLNTNVHVDPSASANASPNITNHIYIRDVRKNGSLRNEVPNKQNEEKPQSMNFHASAVSENNVLTREVELEGRSPEEEEEEHITTTPVKEPQKIYAREVIITTETNKHTEEKEVKPKTAQEIILETYARILLDQNKALLLNLISKQTIIVPKTDLEAIIKAKVGLPCEVTLVDTDGGCCVAKYSPIKKVETIKIINEELVSDFKQVYNNDYNDLINLYHLCLRFCIDF